MTVDSYKALKSDLKPLCGGEFCYFSHTRAKIGLTKESTDTRKVLYHLKEHVYLTKVPDQTPIIPSSSSSSSPTANTPTASRKKKRKDSPEHAAACIHPYVMVWTRSTTRSTTASSSTTACSSTTGRKKKATPHREEPREEVNESHLPYGESAITLLITRLKKFTQFNRLRPPPMRMFT